MTELEIQKFIDLLSKADPNKIAAVVKALEPSPPIPITGMTMEQKVYQGILAVLVVLLPLITTWLQKTTQAPVQAPPAAVQPKAASTSLPVDTVVVNECDPTPPGAKFEPVPDPAFAKKAAPPRTQSASDIVTFSVWDGKKWVDAQGPRSAGCPAWLKKLEAPPFVLDPVVPDKKPLVKLQVAPLKFFLRQKSITEQQHHCFP
jgi:hypothetical protein